jgi:hypothetical protein
MGAVSGIMAESEFREQNKQNSASARKLEARFIPTLGFVWLNFSRHAKLLLPDLYEMGFSI